MAPELPCRSLAARDALRLTTAGCAKRAYSARTARSRMLSFRSGVDLILEADIGGPVVRLGLVESALSSADLGRAQASSQHPVGRVHPVEVLVSLCVVHCLNARAVRSWVSRGTDQMSTVFDMGVPSGPRAVEGEAR